MEINTLPIDTIRIIAGIAPAILLTCREYAAVLGDNNAKVDIMIEFGFTVDFVYDDEGIVTVWEWHGTNRNPWGGPAVSDLYGNETWTKNGALHRDGGPAVTHNGLMMWYQHGELHRDGAPP